MKETKPTKNYEDLPDTIGILDYMAWRGAGRKIADNVFHSKGFPRIQNTGNKLIADKRAVFVYELQLKDDEKQELLKEIARKII